MDNRRKIYLKILISLLALVPISLVHAQQEAQIVHNMYNNVSINPGFVGSVGGICATGILHQQWVGFKDGYDNNVAPVTYLINISSPVNVLHGGVGASVYQDNLGYSKEIGVKIMYAYRTDLGMGNLGIGVQLDFMNATYDFAGLREGAKDDNDPLLQGNEESSMVFDAGFGVQYFVPEKFYIGLSSTRLLETTASNINYTYKRHYFLSGGYSWAFPNSPSFVLEPTLLIKSDLVKTQFDIAALLKYNNKVWGGVSYSTWGNMDPISVLLGLKIKDIKIGYAYSIPTSKIGSGGGHEVMVGYCFKIEMDRGRRSYRNTRFL